LTAGIPVPYNNLLFKIQKGPDNAVKRLHLLIFRTIEVGMKQPDYRHTILFIIFGVTIFIVAVRFILHTSPDNAALIINKKTVSIEDFNKKFNKSSYSQSKNSFIDSFVLKELLVQEALKEGLQKNADFIENMKEQYEQNLAQFMVNSKYKTLDVSVADSMVDKYIGLADKILDITVLNYGSRARLKKGLTDSEEKMSLPYDRLSMEVKYELLTLDEGGLSEPSCSTSQGCSVFRLDKVRQGEKKTSPHEDRETIRRLLTEQKKELLISDWLESLKGRAKVTLGKNVSENGGEEGR
jgi:hypothetical protein